MPTAAEAGWYNACQTDLKPIIPGGHPVTLAVVLGTALAALVSVVYTLTRGGADEAD